jgi:hypothetical protein
MNHPGERPVELVDLQGAWRRDGRTLSGGPMEEVAEVLWLQVGRHFCDLRTPLPQTAPSHMLDQAQAFSGSVRVEGGDISFHHDLDSLPRDPAHPDQGTVHRQSNVMFERGPGFEERWIVASLPGDDIGVAELRPASAEGSSALARLVRVGPLTVAVWGGATPGGAQFDRRQGWARERVHNVDLDEWLIDEAAAALGDDEPLPDGWTVVELEEI